MQRASPTVSIIVNGSPVPLNKAPVVTPTVTTTSLVASVVTPVVTQTTVVTPEHHVQQQQQQQTTPGVPHVVRVSVGIPSAPEPDERSSSGASSGTGSDDEAPYDSDSGAEMKFHMRELEDTRDDEDGGSGKTCLQGPVLDAELAILSRQGTVRGVRNLVRASIKCIADCQEGKVSLLLLGIAGTAARLLS
ncbi:unnamed protein product [Ixodes hexagonus]